MTLYKMFISRDLFDCLEITEHKIKIGNTKMFPIFILYIYVYIIVYRQMI